MTTRPQHFTSGGYTDENDDWVRVHMSTVHTHPDCAFCEQGFCVQRVESCETWGADLVVHGEFVGGLH